MLNDTHRHWAIGIRWLARVTAAVVLLPLFLELLARGFGPHGVYTLAPVSLPLPEIGLLALVFGACAGMLVAWRKEKLGAEVTLVCGLLFLAACFLLPGMSAAWWLGLIVSVPGFLYLAAWMLSLGETGRTASH